MTWTVEFFEEDDGKQPARDFLKSLTFPKRAAAIAAIEAYLTTLGPDVCKSEMGKALGGGLYELRIRHDEKTILQKTRGEAPSDAFTGDVLLRIFFAAYGSRIVLLLGGYDKAADSSSRRQAKHVEQAKRRLRSFERRLRRQQAAQKRKA